MPTDEPPRRRISTFFDRPPPSAAEIEARQHAEAVGAFDAALEGFIAPEMPDAEIERAFRAALSEWRRTAPERAQAERERLAEAERRMRERPMTSVSAPSADAMIDPARVFQDNTDAGKT